MFQTINFSQFCDAFKSLRPNNFSYDGLQALYDYLESYECDTEKGLELDVIALCCDYTEYESLKEFRGDYDGDYKTIEDVENSTTVIKIDDEKFIIQNIQF